MNEAVRYCSKCGSELPAAANYCPKCSAPLAGLSPEQKERIRKLHQQQIVWAVIFIVGLVVTAWAWLGRAVCQ